MDKCTAILFNSVVEGLKILKPYIGEFSIDPIPASYPNGEAMHSHLVAFNVILGLDDPTEEETMKLKTLGWIFDGEYVTLYCPNIYEVPTMEELKKAKNEVQSKV